MRDRGGKERKNERRSGIQFERKRKRKRQEQEK